MGMDKRRPRRRKVAVVGVIAALAAAPVRIGGVSGAAAWRSGQ